MKKKCKHCGCEYEVARFASKRSMYCSRKCGIAQRSKVGKVISCIVCDTQFTKESSRQRCCSEECESALKEATNRKKEMVQPTILNEMGEFPFKVPAGVTPSQVCPIW